MKIILKIAVCVLLMLPLLGGASYSQNTRYLDDVFDSYNTEYGEYEPGYPYILFTPAGDTVKKRPVIVVLHAGGGQVEDITGWCIDFVKKGYVCFSTEYKIGVGNFDVYEQKKAVVQMFDFSVWMRENSDRFGLKVKKVFFMGSSAGAITALQTGISLNDRFTSFFSGFDVPDNRNISILATASLSGAAIPEFNNLINTGDCPNFFYNGEKDLLIPFKAAQTTYDLQLNYGIASNLVGFPDKGHKLENHDFILTDLSKRFYNVLKPNQNTK